MASRFQISRLEMTQTPSDDDTVWVRLNSDGLIQASVDQVVRTGKKKSRFGRA